MKLRTLVAATLPAIVAALYAASANAADPNNVLVPVRANQSLTMNALLGFINSEPVFVNDMLRPIDDQLRGLAKTSHNLSEFREGARGLIDAEMKTYVSTLLVDASAKAALTDDDKSRLDFLINKQRFDLLAQHGGSRALADEALKAQGSSVEKEMDDQRRIHIVQLYLSKQIAPKIVVTRPMIFDEYQRNPKRWQQEAEVELFTITLPVSRWLPRDPGVNGEKGPVSKNPTPAQIQDAKTQAMAEANAITAQLQKGGATPELFAQLAEDKGSSDGRRTKGGRMPGVKRGSRVNQIEEDYIFSLPANTLGQPLFLDDPDPLRARVEIIKVGEKKEPRTIPFAEAQEQIHKEMHAAQFVQLKTEYMQGLFKSAAIEGVDRMADTALDVAVARYATQ